MSTPHSIEIDKCIPGFGLANDISLNPNLCPLSLINEKILPVAYCFEKSHKFHCQAKFEGSALDVGLCSIFDNLLSTRQITHRKHHCEMVDARIPLQQKIVQDLVAVIVCSSTFSSAPLSPPSPPSACWGLVCVKVIQNQQSAAQGETPRSCGLW